MNNKHTCVWWPFAFFSTRIQKISWVRFGCHGKSKIIIVFTSTAHIIPRIFFAIQICINTVPIFSVLASHSYVFKTSKVMITPQRQQLIFSYQQVVSSHSFSPLNKAAADELNYATKQTLFKQNRGFSWSAFVISLVETEEFNFVILTEYNLYKTRCSFRHRGRTHAKTKKNFQSNVVCS